MRKLLAVFALLASVVTASAQVQSVEQYGEQVKALLVRADVTAANNHVDQDHDAILREWATITEINAPSGHEQERAAFIEKLLRGYRLDVHYDATGNLVAIRKGSGGG